MLDLLEGPIKILGKIKEGKRRARNKKVVELHYLAKQKREGDEMFVEEDEVICKKVRCVDREKELIELDC